MRESRKIYWAKKISLFFSPLFWITSGIGYLYWRFFEKGSIKAWQMILMLVITVIIPLSFFLISVKRREIDLDLSERKERFRFYIFSLTCAFIGLGLAYGFSDYIFRLFLALTFTGLSFAVATFWDKISLHVGGLTSFYLVANFLNQWHYFYLFPLIPLIGWF
jgi:hypothetical protein